TQGVGTPQPVRRSPRLSPQKEALEEKRRRKLKLDEEAEESEESAPGTPVQLEDMEEPRDEEMKDEEEGVKEAEEM
ncbi:hypothetical protein KI387_035003, partial [Taxus chinensis]